MATPVETHFEAVYALVRQVPKGRVITYGHIAEILALPGLSARGVGQAMYFAPSDVPWHRVIGAGGMLPVGKRSPEMRLEQLRLLQQENTPFTATNPERIDMSRAGWPPGEPGLFDEEIATEERT